MDHVIRDKEGRVSPRDCAWLYHAHARGLSMHLCMAIPRACAWCSHGHVHGIATRAPVDYLPRGYTIGKHAPRVVQHDI